MNNKHLFAVCLICVICGLSEAVSAQEKNKEQARMPALPAEQPALPALKPEDLLNIRNLQYDQAKRLLEMKDIESRYKKLQSETQGFESAVNAIIEAAAKAASVDLTKWVFDADSLKFVEKKEPEKTAGRMPALPAKRQ